MRYRGVVVEIGQKNQVIIMTTQGEFVKIPFKKHVQVGQEIRYAPKGERLSMWQMGLAATLFLALVGTWPLLSGTLVPTSVLPAYIITLDINPSLELQISDGQKILAVEGLNRDGKELVSQLRVVDKSNGSSFKDGVYQTRTKRSGCDHCFAEKPECNISRVKELGKWCRRAWGDRKSDCRCL